MSILNVAVHPERVLLAVDTHADIVGVAGSTRVEASKLLYLPVPQVLLAARGDTAFMGAVFGNIHRAGTLVDFDALIDTMQVGLDTIAVEYLAHVERAAGRSVAFECEIVVCGWSASACAMQGWAFERWPGDAGFGRSAIPTHRLGPNAGWATAPPPPDDVGLMRALARNQVAFMAQHHPEAAIGGRLITAELQRGQVAIVDQGPIGPKESDHAG